MSEGFTALAHQYFVNLPEEKLKEFEGRIVGFLDSEIYVLDSRQSSDEEDAKLTLICPLCKKSIGHIHVKSTLAIWDKDLKVCNKSGVRMSSLYSLLACPDCYVEDFGNRNKMAVVKCRVCKSVKVASPGLLVAGPEGTKLLKLGDNLVEGCNDCLGVSDE